MMREYAEKLNKIDPLKLVTEKKLKRKHIRMIPVYVGLPLMLIIAGGLSSCGFVAIIYASNNRHYIPGL